MKPITLALSSALLASAATTGFHALFLRQQTPEGPEAATREVAAATVAKPTPESVQPAQLAGRELELLARIADLERSIARLDESAALGAARTVASDTTAPVAAAAPELMREVAHQVIAEKEAAEKATALAAEIERDKERAQRRAEQIAKELGLSSGDQEQLALVYVGESTKRRELFEKLGLDDLRGRDFMSLGAESRDQARDGFRAIREWRNGEIVARLGSSVADQISQIEPRGRNRDWGGFGGDGFGGGGFGGGGGSGGNGFTGGGPGGSKGGG
jgi:hypothetical protein